MEHKKITLVEWIKNNGLNVDYFAMRLKIDKSYIYRISKGQFRPSEALMKKIKKATNGFYVSVDELIGNAD